MKLREKCNLGPQMVMALSTCYNPDASRHNYSLQSAVVMTWVKRVNKSCGVLTKTNDILPLLALTLMLFLCIQLGLQQRPL